MAQRFLSLYRMTFTSVFPLILLILNPVDSNLFLSTQKKGDIDEYRYSQLQAQVTQPSLNNVKSKENRLGKLEFPPDGAPTGRRRGGARRNNCPNLNQPVTALVPGKDTINESQSFLALTVSEYPTFWVYVPQLPINLRFAEFVFQDEKGKNIYRQPMMLPEKSGVIGITLPKNPKYALKTYNKYQWYFKVYCGEPENTSDYFYVKAWVQKVALTGSLENELKQGTRQDYIVYAMNNIWQDALTALAELRRSNTAMHVVGQDWNQLLEAVGLEEFATAPIVKYYSWEKESVR
jgi:hypothetical protein